MLKRLEHRIQLLIKIKIMGVFLAFKHSEIDRIQLLIKIKIMGVFLAFKHSEIEFILLIIIKCQQLLHFTFMSWIEGLGQS